MELTPEIVDEVLIRVAYVGGKPNLIVQMRRQVSIENGLVLAAPRNEPLSEAQAVDIAFNFVRGAAIQAIQLKETQNLLVSPLVAQG